MIPETCGNCKFGNDRSLGGNRLVCVNENCFKSGSVLREHWPSCFYHQPSFNQQLSTQEEDLSWYREQDQCRRERAADYAMNGNHW